MTTNKQEQVAIEYDPRRWLLDFVYRKEDYNDKEEPLLKENTRRFILYPIQYSGVWKFYEEAKASFWTEDEIDLQYDTHDFIHKLNDKERYYLTRGILH